MNSLQTTQRSSPAVELSSKELGPLEKKALLDLMHESPRNAEDLFLAYRFSFGSLPQILQENYIKISAFAERDCIRVISALGIKFFEEHANELQALISKRGSLSAAMLAHLKEEAFLEHTTLDCFIENLEIQGGSTISGALAHSPMRWIKSHPEILLSIREHFGVTAYPILAHLNSRFPDGLNDQLRELIDYAGLSGLGFLVSAPGRELEVVKTYQPLLQSIKASCEGVGRLDAYIASTLYLKESLLRDYPEKIQELATINPSKLPTILIDLKPIHLEKHFELLCDIARYGKSRISEAIQALNLLSENEKDFARQLIFHSGIFSDRAIERRGARQIQTDYAHHQQLLNKYGHAFWGLADQFRSKLHEKEAEHRVFISEIIETTHSGAGHFFAYVPALNWNQEALQFAKKYQNAAGYIAYQRGEDLFKIENDPEYRRLIDFNQEHFHIRWINRYAPYTKQVLDLSLLENNISSMNADQDDLRPLVVFIASHSDPLNSLATKTHLRMLREISKGARLFIAEVGSKDQLIELLQKISEDPSFCKKQQKIDQLIIAAHSDGYSLQLSGARHAPPVVQTEMVSNHQQFISIEDREYIKSINRYLSDYCVNLLIACSAFRNDPSHTTIGRVFEEHINSIVLPGLTKTGSIEDARIDSRGIIEKIYWRDGYTWY